jgi:hypothetical protein
MIESILVGPMIAFVPDSRGNKSDCGDEKTERGFF